MTGPTLNPVSRVDRLAPEEISAVLALAQAAGNTDGVYPLSEHVVLHLRHGGDLPAVHLLARDSDGGLAGYAHVDTTDEVDGASAELVVHPLRRRAGLGRALVTAAIAAADQADPPRRDSDPAGTRRDSDPAGTRRDSDPAGRGRLRLWAHGDHPSASALALSLGFDRARVLWQMRRSLFTPVPAPQVPDGVLIRPFRPGEDDEAWLAVNRRAFADHPDQGRWSLRDLRVRMAEPWFDPDGFLLAVRSSAASRDELLGFHWTKVHGEEHAAESADGGRPHPHDPIGEVYVLGVDPSAHGLGLGTALTLAGLRHLRGHGLAQAMLYVDETNSTATTLYTKLGFARWSTDVSYRRRV